ncbi:helix-turn-helix domain-containing protein [Myroides pelagicus]|uniref:Helix-turn-helix domain-containing protein n=1 Tax=Myroides pelagicus TaxID=270914 RepID=A0A7K1GM18_9FLAO|nr:AraC family transcriptional regulator [Myroides pelagicus]MEC4114310.1 AraC family transcriptional regulator [Myroides pelagicus]MTH29838.1 helix-turn-helix domain-containing protein [Myroides pelagicus]
MARFFFKDFIFLSLGAPFIVFYSPFFYIGLGSLRHVVLESEQKYRWPIIHFVPALLFTIAYGYGVMQANDISVEFLVYYYLVMYIFTAVSLSLYGIYGYVVLSRLKLMYKFRVIVIRVIWIMFFMAIMLVGLVTYNAIPNNDFNIIYIGMLMLAYFVFRFYTKAIKEVQKLPDVEEKYVSGRLDIEEQIIDKTTQASPNQGKYEKSKVADQVLLRYKDQIEEVIINQKMYLRDDFSIEVLEQMTGITRHHLAQVFTLLYDSSFKPFVNQLRINHAIALIEQTQENINVTELGMQCGFNSRTSFFRSFKKNTGVSPSEYIDQHKQQQM